MVNDHTLTLFNFGTRPLFAIFMLNIAIGIPRLMIPLRKHPPLLSPGLHSVYLSVAKDPALLRLGVELARVDPFPGS